MSAGVGISRQRSVSNKAKGVAVPSNSKARPAPDETSFDPCASTASLLLIAQGPVVLCLHHDTLALERRFEKHTKDIHFISADNVSETGAGRLVVTYDVGQTAIVWDLFTGEQYSRFVSYEPLKVAHWMRNGNIAFGNAKGEVILFEPSTSDHISARTIFDPITAIAPSSDCKTYAIGYNNGSILLAALQPSFTILHTLTTSRGPSPIVTLTWHASSSKQKSDMLATQTADGDLRVWSVSKPPTAEPPRVIRVLKRSDVYLPGRNWISWSKNGRIVQYSEGKTWAWDVRTKHVTYDPIPTIEGVKAIACHGPTGTLFTLGPDYTVQQYDIERAQMVANVRHMPTTIPPTPPAEDIRGPLWTTSESEEELASPLVRARRELRASEAARLERNNAPSPQSTISSQKSGIKANINEIISPAGRTDYTTTSFDTGIQSQATPNQVSAQGLLPQSPVMSRSNRKGSRLRQEVIMSPEERPLVDLFPFTRARLHDVPYRAPRSVDESHLTSGDFRRQMLSCVFGWDEDIHDLIRDELSRHPSESQNAIFLARWLDEDPDYLAEIMGSTKLHSKLDWMLLALGTISNQVTAKKITQVFIEKMLSHGDIHAAATLMLALGDRSDAIEVYVSRNQYMDAVLLTCLVYPEDWQRQSYLVRRWGEHVVENSQQSLAIRCFSCTGVEPSDPWTSPKAQMLAQEPAEVLIEQKHSSQPAQVQNLEPAEYPAIYQKMLERRRTVDAPTPVAMPPPHMMTSLPTPPTPYRTAAAQGTRITPQTSALKLITSFGAQPNNQFKFPGLKPDDRTPTVAAAVTPIAESAIDRSALSPGGLGSYRLNNIRSINSALSSKTATPGGFQPSRLASIGETPVDVDGPKFPPQRSVSVPTDLEASKDDGDHQMTPAGNDPQQKSKQALTLLTSARYEPSSATPVKETPQTAVGPQSGMRFPESRARFQTAESGDPNTSRPRNDSKSRKPEGLSIQTMAVQQVNSQQEYLPPTSYQDPISRPATTGTYSNTQIETNAGLTSPPTTGQSYRDITKSPAVTGKSIDQFISSLDQAHFYEKHARARGYSSASKTSRDDLSERRRGRTTTVNDAGEGRRTIPAAKRSPSSPVPMSPEDLRMYSTSVESFDSMYSSNVSGYDRVGTPGSMSKLSRRGSHSTAKGTKHRHRSRSKTRATRSKGGSGIPSRQTSPDATLFSPRGRSASRREKTGHRSPSSPRPMIPSEEDLQSRFDKDSALRLVSRDRHRLHRSTSRQPQRDTSAKRDPSPDRRRPRARSRSRQADEASLSRKTSRSDRQRRHRRPSDTGYERSAHPDDLQDMLPTLRTPQEEPRPASQPQILNDRGRQESAAKQLEARRQSLTRRPSAPNIPLPLHVGAHGKSASTGNMPPMVRAYTDDGTITSAQMHRPSSEKDGTGGGFSQQRPSTPRAMQVTESTPENKIPVPPIATELLTSEVYRPPTREDISSPGSARAPVSLEFLSQIPKHPAYDHRIAGSRSSSKGAEARASSLSRGTSRDRVRTSPREPQMPTMSSPPTDSSAYMGSPPQPPPILPELQHLAAPPPPPPPPPPPKPATMTLASPSVSNLGTFEPEAANVPLPMSAIPTSFSEAQLSAALPSGSGGGGGHRRGRSGHESNGGGGNGSGALLGKIRNFAGRVRSPSRGRKGGDDNQAMSPRMNSEYAAPYESIPSAMAGSVNS
ncbi:uncharacterized protein PV06_05075 [Exophiala oligosperma]|uniref:Gem-associated protein 5 TPR domain-containing protein n=1 Tax=Exophiala oligosperma TaxID=215243 RepID=A0A0D2DM73_9EURO|nr:uncharacterized protein PV06_05075 [Exophiala oligosperma]KIW44033.1 hypothetical protein PV06_05075 [Exophiala oligosperma]